MGEETPPVNTFDLDGQIFTSIELYSHQTCLPLSQCATAAFGGPLAILQCHSDAKKELEIICGGHISFSLPLDEADDISAFGWTSAEELVVIEASGKFSLYSIRAELRDSFLISELLSPQSRSTNPFDSTDIEQCFFGENEFVARLTDGRCLLVYNLYRRNAFDAVHPSVCELPCSKQLIGRSVLSLMIISSAEPSPQLSRRSKQSTLSELLEGMYSGNEGPLVAENALKVVLSLDNASLILCDRYYSQVVLLSALQITSALSYLVTTPNGLFVAAVYTEPNSKLHVVVCSADFKAKLIDVDLSTDAEVTGLQWSGDDAVVVQHQAEVTLIGPLGGVHRLAFDERVLAIRTEKDACRLVLFASCRLLTRITRSIRQIPTSSPHAPQTASTSLLDAYNRFRLGDLSCESIVQSMIEENSLEDSILQCLDIAPYELSIRSQKLLLSAAAYGRSFLPSSCSQETVDALHTIRTLNCLRAPEVGLHLTIVQFTSLGIENIVLRLSQRSHFALALKTCDIFEVSQSSVLEHWAWEKTRQMLAAESSDEAIVTALSLKLSSRGSQLHLSKLALTIHDRLQLPTLARKLLSFFESDAESVVVVLLKMKNYKDALGLALNLFTPETCNNLLYDTVFYVIKEDPDFLRLCDLSILNEPRFDAIRSTSSILLPQFADLFRLNSFSGLLSLLLHIKFTGIMIIKCL